jgi:hypothetical protein
MRLAAAAMVLALAGSMLSPALARDEVSAGAFLKGYDDPSPRYRGYHPSWTLDHFAEALAEVNRFLVETRNERPLYCTFEDHTIHGVQLADYLKLAVRKEPALARRPDGQALLYALQKEYPCPEWDKSGSIEAKMNAATLPRARWRPAGVEDGWPWSPRDPRFPAYFRAFRWANFHLTRARKTAPLYCFTHDAIWYDGGPLDGVVKATPRSLLDYLRRVFTCPERADRIGRLRDSS